MGKMKLVLLEQDHYFIDMISSYVRSSEYAGIFTMSVFTSKEQGFSFIGQSEELYILLVHESFLPLPERMSQLRYGCLIILSDTPVPADIVEYPVLCKYQPLNKLLAHIVSHFNEYSSNRMLRGNKISEIIGVYSAVGGSGKTLAAVHLARELVFQGKRVFYLNLERLPSVSWLKPADGEENCFTRMLYYGKSGLRVQTAKVDRFKRRHLVMGFDYFPGVPDPAEMSEMTEQDTESLIRSVLASGAYDCILLDLDSSLHPRITASLKLCEQILWLIIDDRIHMEKTKLQMRQIIGMGVLTEDKLHDKLKLVVNKYGGSMSSVEAALQHPISGYLPYIPEWKAIGSMETLQVRGAFSESLSGFTWLNSPSSGGEAHVVG